MTSDSANIEVASTEPALEIRIESVFADTRPVHCFKGILTIDGKYSYIG